MAFAELKDTVAEKLKGIERYNPNVFIMFCKYRVIWPVYRSLLLHMVGSLNHFNRINSNDCLSGY